MAMVASGNAKGLPTHRNLRHGS